MKSAIEIPALQSFIMFFIEKHDRHFCFSDRDAKALQEKLAKKAAQGGNNGRKVDGKAMKQCGMSTYAPWKKNSYLFSVMKELYGQMYI